MPYALHIDGRAATTFDTPEQAEAAARDLLRENADRRVEIIDLATNRPYAPAASADDREALARRIGF